MSNVSSSFGNLLGSSSTSLDPNSITSSIDQKKFSIPDASGNYLSLNDVSGNGVDASGNILVNNWSKFASQVFQNFIYTLLFGLIGSNFIWFSVLNTTELDELLPSGKEDNDGNWVPDNFYSCCKDDASKKAAEDKVKKADEKRKAAAEDKVKKADEKRKAAQRTATAATLSDAAKQVKSQQEKDKVSPKQTKDFSPVTNKGPSTGNVEMEDLSSKSVPEQMASQLKETSASSKSIPAAKNGNSDLPDSLRSLNTYSYAAKRDDMAYSLEFDHKAEELKKLGFDKQRINDFRNGKKITKEEWDAARAFANKKGGADLETLKKIKARKNADDNNNTTCPTGPSVDITDIKKLLPYMGMNSNGWPYSETDGIPDWKRQKNAEGYDFLTTQGFLNWFGETVGQSYQTSRGWLKDFIRLFSPIKGHDGDNINLWSWHPIMMIVSFIFFTVGCFSPIITIPIFIILAFKIDWIWGLSTTLLFGLLPTTATIVSGLQFMQFVATFTILPLILDPKGIKLILHCNVTFLTILFGALTVGSAYQTLETTTATTMAIGFLIIIIPSIMKFFNWGQGSSGLKY